MVAATWAIAEALKRGKPPAKPPIKRQPPTTPRAAPYLPKTPVPTTTRTHWPTRVPVDTARYAETPQKDNVEAPEALTPTRKPRAHKGSGPFGMSQREFKAAQKSTFKWHVGPDEYDDTVTGWVEGISEDETLQSGQAENLESHI
jgi:hypothetical protein